VTPALIRPKYFREMATIAKAGGPPDQGKVKAVMIKCGLVPALPQKKNRHAQSAATAVHPARDGDWKEIRAGNFADPGGM